MLTGQWDVQCVLVGPIVSRNASVIRKNPFQGQTILHDIQIDGKRGIC